MALQKVLVGELAAKYLPLGKSLMRQVKRLGLPKKFVALDGALIFADRLPHCDRITIIAQGSAFDFLLHDGTNVWGLATSTGSTIPLYTGTVLDPFNQLHLNAVSDTAQTLFTKSGAGLLTSPFTTGRVFGSAVGYGFVTSPLADIDITGDRDRRAFLAGVPPVDDMLQSKEQLGISLTRQDLWNGLTGPELWTVPVAAPAGATNDWHWAPRIWHPEPQIVGESFEFNPGMYYGSPSDTANLVGPEDTVETYFGGHLIGCTGTKFGHSEVLARAGSTDYCRVYVYLNDSFTAGRSSSNVATEIFGGEQRRAAYNDYYKSLTPAPLVFDLAGVASDTTVVSWVYKDDDESADYGVLAYSGDGEWRLYRVVGVTSLGVTVYTPTLLGSGTEVYDHSLLSSGEKVTLHNSPSVTVYEMAGGGASVFTVDAFTDGEFIPATAPTATPPAEATTLTDIGFPSLRSFMGGAFYIEPLTYQKNAPAWKVAAGKEGSSGKIKATGVKYSDDCFESKWSVIRPNDPSNLARTHSAFVDGVEYSAGSFSELLGIVPYGFYGAGVRDWNEVALAKWDGEFFNTASVSAGQNTTVETIEFTSGAITTHIDGYVKPPDNFTAPLVWSGTETKGPPSFVLGEYPKDDNTDCRGDQLVEVTDFCGHTAEKRVNVVTPRVAWPSNYEVGVGTTIRIYGREHSFSPPCGSVSYVQESDTIHAYTFTDVSGCCGSEDFTAYFGCDQSETVSLRYPSGVWVAVESGSQGGDAAGPGSCSTGAPCSLTYTEGRYRLTSNLRLVGPPEICTVDDLPSNGWTVETLCDANPSSCLGWCSPPAGFTALMAGWTLLEWQCP